MRKNVIFIVFFFTLISSVLAEDIFNISGLNNQAQSYVEEQLQPVVKTIAGGLNTGLYAPVSGKVIAFGIQANVVSLPTEGVFSTLTNSSDYSYLPVPFAYVGARIPFVGINVMARGLIIPIDADKKPTVIGFGIGWEPDLLPILSTKVMIDYHLMSNFPMLPSISSTYPNVNISFKNIEGESIIAMLDLAGICVSTGSACSSHSLDSSHVIMALEENHERSHSSIRFTLSKFTTKDELDFVILKIKEVVETLRKISPFGFDNLDEWS